MVESVAFLEHSWVGVCQSAVAGRTCFLALRYCLAVRSCCFAVRSCFLVGRSCCFAAHSCCFAGRNFARFHYRNTAAHKFVVVGHFAVGCIAVDSPVGHSPAVGSSADTLVDDQVHKDSCVFRHNHRLF